MLTKLQNWILAFLLVLSNISSAAVAKKTWLTVSPHYGFSPVLFWIRARTDPGTKAIRLKVYKSSFDERTGDTTIEDDPSYSFEHPVEQENEDFYLCLAEPVDYQLLVEWLKGQTDHYEVYRREQTSVSVKLSPAWEAGQTTCGD